METEKEINIWKVVEKKNAEEKEGKYSVRRGKEKQNRKRRKIIGQRRKKMDEREEEEGEGNIGAGRAGWVDIKQRVSRI